MKRKQDASLKHLNSFSVEAHAGQLIELESEQDLHTFSRTYRFDKDHDLIMGGGSNILFAGDVAGTVVLNRIGGMRIIEDSDDEVVVEAHAGENWHQLVLWCLDQGLSGIENLSLIPGLAGAAPMQNIGAYGVELADVLEAVRSIDLSNGQYREFAKDECQLKYRNSRFKSADAGKYLITGIRLRLQRHFKPKLEYKGLAEELRSMGINSPTAQQVSAAVIRIRQRKLPNPKVYGNAGSFFKNPVVKQATADGLLKEFVRLPVYPAGRDAKLSAAWLIDQCGWKGRSMERAAVSDQHALVLINKGGATGAEILTLAETIQSSVRNRFGVDLQPEPLIIR